ncbi:hypothetical protein [Chitinimonas lacunae]|uniref:Secreted protein n=1 Tax=Chitinimonas lacunae TaxID=1963018 RepID=A0ABV8MNM2_9NEIS
MKLLYLLCMVLAMPVLASNEDYERGYRRGYEDGFRAGTRQQVDDERGTISDGRPVDRPRPPARITVAQARYGSWRNECDVTDWVAQRANGRYSLMVQVTNEMCGDPDRGKSKSLQVRYYCGDKEKTASAPEHRNISLSCP